MIGRREERKKEDVFWDNGGKKEGEVFAEKEKRGERR